MSFWSMLQKTQWFSKNSGKPSKKERFAELCEKMGEHAEEMEIKKEYVNQLIHDCRKEINKIHILNKF